MKVEIDLFPAHAEFNQIIGLVIGVLDNNAKTKGKKKASIEKSFPSLVKLVDEINNEMQKYSIT